MFENVFEFQLQGVVNGITVFSIINKEGHYYYKLDENFDINRTSYIDVDLSACNTVHQSADGIKKHSKAQLVTEQETLELISKLEDKNVLLDGIGYFNDFKYRVRKYYPFVIKHETGSVSYNFYDGVTKQDAIKKALANNPILIGIELYSGDINQSPFNKAMLFQ